MDVFLYLIMLTGSTVALVEVGAKAMLAGGLHVSTRQVTAADKLQTSQWCDSEEVF